MQQQSNEQNKFLIDADIGDDDVTLPSLPVVNVPIVETKEQTVVSPVVVAETSAEEADVSAKGGFFSRMKEGLTKTRKNLADGMVNILIGGKEIDDELLEEVEEQLLVADIGVDATKTIITNLTERTARGDLIYSHSLYKALQEELVALLAPRVKPLHIDPNKTPYVILVVGVNGVGKTTTIGKLAKRLQGEGKKVMLAAGD
ncbi:MAG: signal recognition particle receptor subunit alpha, partial [Acinetobacter sp.]